MLERELFTFLILISEDSLLIVVFRIDATGATLVVIFIVVSGIVFEHLSDFSGEVSFDPDEEDPLSVLLVSARVRCFSLLLLDVGDVP